MAAFLQSHFSEALAANDPVKLRDSLRAALCLVQAEGVSSDLRRQVLERLPVLPDGQEQGELQQLARSVRRTCGQETS